MKIVEFKDYDNQTTPLSAYNLNRLQQNLITTKYQMTFSSAVSGGSTITLPCYYQVGQDTLDVYLNSELLKKASTKDSEGHYYEVGNSDTKSNQIKITSDWSIASGDVLNLIVRGTTDSYDQNLSPDKATQLADEISANKEEITNIDTKINSKANASDVANTNSKVDNLKAENEYLKSVVEQAFTPIEKEGTSINYDNTINARFKDIKLCGDTTQDGTPTPENPVEINVVTENQNVRILGKNFVNTFYWFASSRTISKDGITLTIKDNGKLDIQGTATANTGFDIARYIYLGKNKDYFFSSNIKYDVTNFNLSAQYLGSNNKTFFWLSGNKIDRTKYSGEMIKIVYYIPANTVVNLHDVEIQIEEGNTATTYEPYQGNTYPLSLGSIELCKIGGYQDYIYKKDDKWWKHKAIGKIKLLSTINWFISNTLKIDTYAFSLNSVIFNNFKQNILAEDVLCNYFSSGTDEEKEATFYILHNNTANNFYFRFKKKGQSTLDEFKTWIDSNNVYLYYQVETPGDEQITDTTLITQLNNLSKSTTYAGETNIVATSDGLTIIPKTTALTK